MLASQATTVYLEVTLWATFLKIESKSLDVGVGAEYGPDTNQ
jgi:hypothetical protein